MQRTFEVEKSQYKENVSQTKNLSVNEALRELVNHYLKQFPSLTLNAFSKRTKVPGTTLLRLLKEESSAKNQECAPHLVLNLCSYIYKEKRISHLLELVPGVLGDFLKKSFDQFIFSKDSSSHQLDLDLEDILKDEINYILYKLGANKLGTTRSEIHSVLGAMGINRLQKLIELGVLLEDHESGQIHSKEKNFSLSLPLAKKHAHTLIDFYKESQVANGNNLFYSLSEGMTLEGIKKIKDIEKDAVKKIHEIMNQEAYQGSIPYFALILSETLLPHVQSLTEASHILSRQFATSQNDLMLGTGVIQ